MAQHATIALKRTGAKVRRARTPAHGTLVPLWPPVCSRWAGSLSLTRAFPTVKCVLVQGTYGCQECLRRNTQCVLPDATSDDRPDRAPAADSDRWYRENRPPHHDR